MENPGNGWILCQSKTIEDSYYYFNVRTGESAWAPNSGSSESKRSKTTYHTKAQYNPLHPTASSTPFQSKPPWQPSTHSFSYPHQQTPYNKNYTPLKPNHTPFKANHPSFKPNHTSYNPNQTNPFLAYKQPLFGSINDSFQHDLNDPRTKIKTSNKSVQTEPRLGKRDMATQTDDDIQVQHHHTSIPLCERFSSTKPKAVKPPKRTANDVEDVEVSKTQAKICNLSKNDLRLVLLKKMGKYDHNAVHTSNETTKEAGNEKDAAITRIMKVAVEPPSLSRDVKCSRGASNKTAEATVRATPNKAFNLLDSDIATPSSHFLCQNYETQYEMDDDEATFGNQLSDRAGTRRSWRRS